MLFYDKLQTMRACEEDPSLIFELIKDGYFDVVDELISKNKVSINVYDNIGNDVMMKLLKYKQYNLILKFMNKRDWDVNHQNDDGNTFGHLLMNDNSIHSLKLFMRLSKKKNYIPNIKNRNGESVFDRAIKNDSVVALKILKDKRFDNIDILSLKKLFDTYINNNYYGKYSKISNLDIIVESLEKKDLLPNMRYLIEKIKMNIDLIKNAIMKNKLKAIDNFINTSLMEATV